eukprot:PhM_4_TR10601/c0_g1_i1/m.76146
MSTVTTTAQAAAAYSHALLDPVRKLHQNLQLKHLVSNNLVEVSPLADVKSLAPPGAKPDGVLRFVCVSDTHSQHDSITAQLPPDADVFVHAGDFTDVGTRKDVARFNDWLGTLPYKHKLVIAGNHDLSFDPEIGNTRRGLRGFGNHDKLEPDVVKAMLTNCTYLENTGVVIDGVHIFGTPYQPWFHDWAFNLSRGEECREMWETLPTSPHIDVLVSHGPPLGHGDLCSSSEHAGCADLLEWVEEHVPSFHVFGHIHEGFGVTTNSKGTVFVNASTMNLMYDAKNPNPPIVFDVCCPSAATK